MEEFAPAPAAPRFDAIPRRPFRPDDARPAPSAPKLPGEPAASEMQEPTAPSQVPESTDLAGTPDAAKPSDGKPAPQKSMYDSLEQEMASLLNRPPSKP
jgi:hypothetical protein